MPLTLVTGRANSGKTGVVHERLRGALARGMSPVLVLPTQPDVRRAEAELGATGLVGAQITVFDAWLEEMWSLFGDGRRLVTDAARNVLVSEAARCAEAAPIGGSAGSTGFSRLLADIVTRLRDVPSAEGDGVAAAVAAVVRRYHGLATERGLIEPVSAAALLGSDPPPTGPVLVNRFTDLTAAQESLLTGLARRSEVVVALTWEREFPATQALTPIIERMFPSAEHVVLPTPVDESELGMLEARLYRPGESPTQPSGQLELGLAAGAEAEAALAARVTSELIAQGFAPERIAVVFRDLGSRLGMLEAAMCSEGVPAEFDVAMAVSATLFGRALGALLDVRSGRDGSRERLLAYLLSPYSDAGADEVVRTDARWRRTRADAGVLLRDSEGMGPLTRRALRAAAIVCSPGLDASAARAWKDLADAMLACALRNRAAGSAEARLDASVHRALLRTVSELEALDGIRLGESDVARALADRRAATATTERAGAVQVTEAHRVRSRRFDALVLGGLTAAEFSAERPEPLAAELLRRLGAPAGTEERDAERMLFYTIATHARRRLVLLRQSSDARGEAVRPSVFWDDVLDTYRSAGAFEEPPEPPEGVRVRRLHLTDLAEAAPSFAPGRRQQRRVAEGSAAQEVVRGRLVDPDVLAVLAVDREFSVTELETYLACPYQWFYARAVRPRELDVAFDARERGSRAHRILAAFYAALPERLGVRRVGPACLSEALALLEEVAAAVGDSAETRAIGLREELAAAQAVEWARAIVSDDADLLPGFEPHAHELAFGTPAERPFTLAGVMLKGSVDRVERGAAGLVVTDYKSDRAPVGWESFGTRGLIQVPMYAAAAAELLGEPVIGGVYRSFRSLAQRGFWRKDLVCLDVHGKPKDGVDDAQVDVVLAEAGARARTAADGIRRGDIAPRPATRAACEFCGARAFCEEAR